MSLFIFFLILLLASSTHETSLVSFFGSEKDAMVLEECGGYYCLLLSLESY
jgi:hypothetical protein